MLSADSKQTKLKNLRGQGDSLARNPYGIVITSTDSHSEMVNYEGPRAGRFTPVTHPYLGPNSWIRVMPESRTTAVMGTRAEDGETFIQAYIQESADKGADLPTVVATQEERFHYRSLQEGEIDIMSRGIAGTHYGRNGNQEIRGGINSVTLDAYRMENRMRSPSYQQAILGNKRQEIGDEIRFGVVRRPNSLSTRFVTDSTLQDIIQAEPPTLASLSGGTSQFAKEYLRKIRSKTGDNLVDHREGVVVDDDGTLMESDTTGNKLRSKTTYGTYVGEATEFEVDEEGNVVLTVPATAKTGVSVDVGLGPGLGFDLKITVAKDILMSVGKSILMDALSEITMTGPVFNANTLLVNLVKGADTPMVRGNELLQWLATHIHPTQVGPSQPPVQVATLTTILSQFATLR